MDLSRDEAAVLMASLACTSDGQATADERDLVHRRLVGPMARLGEAGEKLAFDRLYTLLAERGPEWALDTIGRALPRRADRLAALRLAADIVDADGSVTREEHEHLEALAQTLGLTHNDLEQAGKPDKRRT